MDGAVINFPESSETVTWESSSMVEQINTVLQLSREIQFHGQAEKYSFMVEQINTVPWLSR